MLRRTFVISLLFLLAGILWAVLNDPLISLLGNKLAPATLDMVRSLSDIISVSIVAVFLYFILKKKNKRLAASEEQYRRLFEANPNPMWVYDVVTMRFVKVNRRAIEIYGYSKSEFLSMTIMDIRHKSEHERLLQCLENLGTGVNRAGNWKHTKKGGETLYASIVTYDLVFNGKASRLAMITDVTEMILKEEKIKAQNAILHDLAWSNSHEVRGALCSVMSLIELLKDTPTEPERRACIALLDQCTRDFDAVLKKNNERVDNPKDNFILSDNY